MSTAVSAKEPTRPLTGGSHLAFTMAALTLVRGVAAYAPAGAMQPLIAGLLYSGGFGLSGYLIHEGEQVLGFKLATVNSLLLGWLAGLRFVRTKKVMPALPFSVLGFASAYYHGNKYIEWS